MEAEYRIVKPGPGNGRKELRKQLRIVSDLRGDIDRISNSCKRDQPLQMQLDIVRHGRKRKALRRNFIRDQDTGTAG